MSNLHVLLGREGCAPCKAAKQTLDTLGVWYVYVDIEETTGMRDFLTKVLGVRTVPQILIVSDLKEVVNDVT